MNIYLLELIFKWISFLFVTLTSFIGTLTLNESNLVSTNNNNLKSLSIVNEIVPFETKYVFKSNIPSNIKREVVAGINGVIYTSQDGDVETFRDVQNKVVNYGSAPVGNYTGKMTGYGPDCATCNGIGTVGCPAPGRVYHNLVKDGVYYDDSEYGEIRILAATKNEFPCGTIIEVTNNGQKFMGIVLDRGAAMENAYKAGNILIDLAFSSETEDLSAIRAVTSSNVNFSVQRWGFEK